ncbi:RBBP9/YdeN family alpha/beta hydrolase [Sulfurimonas sp.]
MAQKVLLLHGWGGSDFPHWQSWLAGELARDYGCVNFLRFSDVERPKLDVWLRELTNALRNFQPDIVICHSLANTLWFHANNKGLLTQEVKNLYLVAPPSLKCNVTELSEFFPLHTPQNLSAKKILLVTSTNDPYLTQEEAKTLQQELDVPMNIIQNGGHLNAESGYGEWPWILQEIKRAGA